MNERHEIWQNASNKAGDAYNNETGGHIAQYKAARAVFHKELATATREQLYDMVAILSMGGERPPEETGYVEATN